MAQKQYIHTNLAEFRRVKNLQGKPVGDLTYGSRMEAVNVVAVARLHKNGALTLTLRIQGALVGHVCQPDALTDVATRVLDGRVPVDVRKQAQRDLTGVVGGRVGESVDLYSRRRHFDLFANSGVQLVVANGSPVFAGHKWNGNVLN